MNVNWLLRAKRLAQNPPSLARVKLFAAVLAICLTLYGIEQVFGWPDWLVPNDTQRLP